jgi:hypothetical protein
MDWLLVITLMFSDGSAQVVTTPTPTKASCRQALYVIGSTINALGVKAKFAAVCLNQKTGEVESPEEEEEKPKPSPNKSLRWVQT